MKWNKLLLITILLSLLTGCENGFPFGDNLGRTEIATVNKTDKGLCFHVKDVGDFRPTFLTIKLRDTPITEGFHRELPALTVANGQLCIPDTYYHFPNNGEFYVNNTLRSPTKTNQILTFISVFRLVNGEPQMLEPRKSEF